MNRNVTVSTFQAAKGLKHTQDELTELHNRIRLLQEHEKRHNKNIEINHRCLESLDEKRKRVQEESQQRRNRHEEALQMNKRLQERNRVLRELRAKKMHNIKEDIHQSKKVECGMAKDTSSKLDQKMYSLKQSYLENNKQRRDLVMLEKEKGKENIRSKQDQRSEIIRNSTHKTIDQMIQKKRRREQQILRLQEIQAELLERCRTSNGMSLSLKEEISGKRSTQTPKSYVMLPSIRAKKPRYTAQDFYRGDSSELLQ